MTMSMSLMPMNGCDHAAGAVDQEVAAQEMDCVGGDELHAPQRQWDETDDDQRVEDHRGEDRRAGALQVHDVEVVEDTHAGEAGEHCGDDGEVFGDVVGDGERRERSAGDEELLADLDDVDELGGIGVEVDHVPGFLGRLGAGVHRHAHVGLGERGGVVGAVTRHRDQAATPLLTLDEVHLVFGGGFGEEVVDAGFLGDDRGGARVVAGDHHGADPHAAQVLEPFARCRA